MANVVAVLNIAVKLVLVWAIVFMLTNPDLPQFEAKSLTWRAAVYPIMTLLVAAGYYWRRMKGSYPHLADLLWSFTFTFDIVSNNLHLYGTYANYDDIVHFINAIPYMLVLISLLLSLERLDSIKMGYAGAVFWAFTLFLALHFIWEVSEHLFDRFLGTELQPGGMVEATDNSIAAAAGALVAIVVLHYWRRTRAFESLLFYPMMAYLARLLNVGYASSTGDREVARVGGRHEGR